MISNKITKSVGASVSDDIQTEKVIHWLTIQPSRRLKGQSQSQQSSNCLHFLSVATQPVNPFRIKRKDRAVDSPRSLSMIKLWIMNNQFSSCKLRILWWPDLSICIQSFGSRFVLLFSFPTTGKLVSFVWFRFLYILSHLELLKVLLTFQQN